jgi:hypothetical protein
MSAYAAGSAMARLPASVSPEMTRLQPRFSTKLPNTYWKLSTALTPPCGVRAYPTSTTNGVTNTMRHSQM